VIPRLPSFEPFGRYLKDSRGAAEDTGHARDHLLLVQVDTLAAVDTNARFALIGHILGKVGLQGFTSWLEAR
jgi:hypothetical protein